MHDIEIENSEFHGGSAAQGWFGLEIRCATNVSIHQDFSEGGQVLISLPYVKTAHVYSNFFNLSGKRLLGVEVAAANNVTLDHNTFNGDGPRSNDTAVSMNSGSVAPIIT